MPLFSSVAYFFFMSGHTSDFQFGTSVAAPPGAWYYIIIIIIIIIIIVIIIMSVFLERFSM